MPDDRPYTPAELDGTWGGVDFNAVKVLTVHQRRDIGSCMCGWGVNTGDLGRSHALHVWRELQRAVLPDHDARVRAEARVPLLSLIEDLADDGPCHYDHHGYCQGHSLDPKPCPHERAKRVLARAHATTEGDHHA